MTFNLQAQNLSDYKWDNRLIVIYAESLNNGMIDKQLEGFDIHDEGWKERKLRCFIVTPGTTVELKDSNVTDKVLINGLNFQNRKKVSPFEIQLIGLDGGVKLSKDEPVKLETIYALIDGMPMRISEMQEKGKI
jgi:hypothetical protein